MGATTCDIHGFIGLNFACRHVVDNIRSGSNEKCFLVSIRVIPGEKSNEWQQKEITFLIPFCLQCYEDKRITQRMKVENDVDSVEKAITDFEIDRWCSLCIEEYGQRNRLN